MTANWKSRWEKAQVELKSTRREVTALRTALDEVNAETESILNDGLLIGHELAKSHAIRTQMASIRSLRAQLNERTTT